MKFDDLDLFSDSELEQNVFNIIQKCICDIYNVAEIGNVDAADFN